MSSHATSNPPGRPHALILASASPRRRYLLAQLHLPFTVMPADIAEEPREGEAPEAYVIRLARAKAHHLAARFPQAVVLGADTTVVLEGEILGKPTDIAAARQMLRRLSGRRHRVITGLAVVQQCRPFSRLDTVTTQVCFHPLIEADIEAYIATGEPFDKAGAYAIQGRAAAFIEAVEGCYTNVVGLPLRRTALLLRAAGLPAPMPPVHSGKSAS